MGSIAAEALRRQIEESFSAVPYPGDDKIVSHPCDECDELAESLRGKKWQDWKDNPLGLMRPPKDQGIPALLTPEAFQHYLPLILLASILHYRDANLIPGNLVSAFAPADDKLKDYQRDRIRILSKAQLSTVAACLRHLKQEHSNDLPGYEIDRAISFVEENIHGRN